MGRNFSGQLGDGSNTDRTSAVEIETTGVTAIAAGQEHSLYLKASGSLWGMGGNQYGQLGIGSTEDKNSSVEIVADDVTDLAAGFDHSLYIRNGTLLAMAGINTNNLEMIILMTAMCL